MANQARSYADYLKVPELLALQRCLSEPPEHDETLFIVVHQVYELWFKLMLLEVDTIIGRMTAGDARQAARLFRRLHEIQQVLIRQVAVLETMAPQDFLRFRDHLKPASGFQSYQFRELEFASGLKDPRYLEAYREEPELGARLRARLEEPSLADAWEALLRRRGCDYPELPPETPEQERLRRRSRRIEALLSIYADTDRHHDLYCLAEAMIQYDENLSLWRWHHVRMVERMIGMKQGTGGSEGVGYLQTTLGKRCFPELWELRTHLGDGGFYGEGRDPAPEALG